MFIPSPSVSVQSCCESTVITQHFTDMKRKHAVILETSIEQLGIKLIWTKTHACNNKTNNFPQSLIADIANYTYRYLLCEKDSRKSKLFTKLKVDEIWGMLVTSYFWIPCLKKWKTQKCSLTYSFVWLWAVHFQLKGRRHSEGIWEKGAEETILGPQDR